MASGKIAHTSRRIARGRALVRVIWDEFGGWGRTGLVAFVFAMSAVVAMGMTIARAAQDDLLAARADLQAQVVATLDVAEVLDSPGAEVWSNFDEAIRLRLLGGETVRVKLWDPTGRVVYSDVDELVGETFELSADSLEAFDGATIVELAEVDGPENVFERDLGELIEFYLPVMHGDEVVGVFEIYQTAGGLQASLERIRRDVWTSILVGIGLLGLFIGSLILANINVVNRRRLQAEQMSDELMRVAEADRARIVEAMHDDIGQPLYRILYGLQGARARIVGADVDAELGRLEHLVRGVDGALRSELRLLNRAALNEVGLVAAVEDLVEATHTETDLTVAAAISALPELSSGSEAALFRAVQESLFNIRKHAGRGVGATVQIGGAGNRVTATITDNGVGWSGAEGVGIATTRRGLEAIGGGLSVSRRAETGTIVRAWVPVVRSEEFV